MQARVLLEKNDRSALAEELASQVNDRLKGKAGFRKITAGDILSDQKAAPGGIMQALLEVLRTFLRRLYDLPLHDLERSKQGENDRGNKSVAQGKPETGQVDGEPTGAKNVIQGVRKGEISPVNDGAALAVKAFETASRRDFLGEAAEIYNDARDRFSLAAVPAPGEVVEDYLKASQKLVEQLESQYDDGLEKILDRYRKEPKLLEAVESARRALRDSQVEPAFQYPRDGKFGPLPGQAAKPHLESPIYMHEVEGAFGPAPSETGQYVQPYEHRM